MSGKHIAPRWPPRTPTKSSREDKREGAAITADQALIEVLKTYQAPISREAMHAQIDLALKECTNKSLIPVDWR